MLILPPNSPTLHTAAKIYRDHVETGQCHRYLGVYSNDSLEWRDNAEALYRKGQSRLFILRWLTFPGVCSKQTFHHPVLPVSHCYCLLGV